MKKITLFFAAMFFAMTAFAANIPGGTKIYFDLSDKYNVNATKCKSTLEIINNQIITSQVDVYNTEVITAQQTAQ